MIIEANILKQPIIKAEIKTFSGSTSEDYQNGYNEGFLAGETSKENEILRGEW